MNRKTEPPSGLDNSRFALTEAAFFEVWRPSYDRVFRGDMDLAGLEVRAETGWVALPEMIFRDGFRFTFLRCTAGPFETPDHFALFRRFLYNSGESAFSKGYLIDPGEASNIYASAFPAETEWEWIRPCLRPVGEHGELVWVPALSAGYGGVWDSWLLGQSGRWGAYHWDDLDLLIVGTKDERTTQALREAFDVDSSGRESGIEPEDVDFLITKGYRP